LKGKQEKNIQQNSSPNLKRKFLIKTEKPKQFNLTEK